MNQQSNEYLYNIFFFLYVYLSENVYTLKHCIFSKYTSTLVESKNFLKDI